MQKILVLDHPLNSESIASCSIEYNDTRFFGLNTSISIEENLNLCQPDTLLINKHFVTPELLHQMLMKFNTKAKVYNAEYLIPNYYTRDAKEEINGDVCVICLHDNHVIDSTKPIKINNYYAAIYSYKINLNHAQLAGFFEHTKELFQICKSRNTVIDASGGYLEGFCKFYGWNYGVFKPNGTIAISKASDNTKSYLSNKEIYEQIM